MYKWVKITVILGIMVVLDAVIPYLSHFESQERSRPIHQYFYCCGIKTIFSNCFTYELINELA